MPEEKLATSGRSNGYAPEKINGSILRKGVLKSITVYPIKSCGGFNANSWPLTESGLLHDREWILKSPDGKILTSKKVPAMSLINTSIDLAERVMFVDSPHCKERLTIYLSQCYEMKEEILTESQRYEVHGYGDDINLWFTKAISRTCSLFKCVDSESFCTENKSKLNFVNEAQFLIISEESVSDLNIRINSKKEEDNDGEPIYVSPMRFRPNLVISGAPAYAEDNWRSFTIGKTQFTSIGGCSRNQMVNLDPYTGQKMKSKEPLETLASYRRVEDKILFGIMLRSDISENASVLEVDMQPQLQVGQILYPS